MSKHMQLAVVVHPYYETDLEKTYPGLARSLGRLDPGLVARNPSLYELAGQLDLLLYRFDGTRVRQALLRHGDTLRGLYKKIQEHIADRDLTRADTLLYSMEDVFDQIESELS